MTMDSDVYVDVSDPFEARYKAFLETISSVFKMEESKAKRRTK